MSARVAARAIERRRVERLNPMTRLYHGSAPEDSRRHVAVRPRLDEDRRMTRGSDEVERIDRTLTFSALDAFRKRCDPLADDVLASIWADTELRKQPDLLGVCRTLAERRDPAAKRFIEHTHTLPRWMIFDEFALGRALFFRHGILTFLVGFTALIDSYAGANDNKVLVFSGRLGEKGAFRRLVETASFTVDVLEEDALRPGARGHAAALSVRLLHAKVRRLCRMRSYDVARYDEPINQEALCGTLMLFSSGIVFALERLGVRVRDDEKESYHALWRSIGWLMGVDEALLPETWAGECAVYRRVKDHQYWPDADTRALFESAVRGVSMGARSLPLEMKLLGAYVLESERFLRAFVGRCVDPRLGEYLGVRPKGLESKVFDMAHRALALFSIFESRAPGLKTWNHRAQSAIIHRILRDFSAESAVRFEDPGFSTGARAAI
jgi:hypothetical protein